MIDKADFISILLFYFVVSLFVPVTTNAAQGTKLISIKNANGTEISIYGESHALVIGGSDYTGGWPKLPGVLKDIELVKEALEAKGFNVVLVKDPDGRGLEDAFEGFIEKYGYKRDNRLLFYFAGHGHTVKPKYGGEELGYIVPVEAPNPYTDIKKFRRVSMSMQRIEEYALNIDAKHALFIFDSCFSGSLFALSRAVPEHINYKTAQPVRQFITSGGAEEKVPDVSIFRQQFIAALEGEGDQNSDGYMTAAELSSFLFKNVVNYSKGAQHPQYGKIRNPNLDKGDFVFRVAKVEGVESMETDSSDSVLLEFERQRLAEEKEQLEREKRELEQLRLLAVQRQNLEAERIRLENQKKQIELQSPSESNQQLASIGNLETQRVKVKAREGNFVAYEDGTVLDTENNLMWWSEGMREDEWTLAKYKARNFRGGGYSDWRLPSPRELRTIYDRRSDSKYKSIKFIKLASANVFSNQMASGSDFDTRSGSYVSYLSFKSGQEGKFNLQDNFVGRMTFVPVRVPY